MKINTTQHETLKQRGQYLKDVITDFVNTSAGNTTVSQTEKRKAVSDLIDLSGFDAKKPDGIDPRRGFVAMAVNGVWKAAKDGRMSPTVADMHKVIDRLLESVTRYDLTSNEKLDGHDVDRAYWEASTKAQQDLYDAVLPFFTNRPQGTVKDLLDERDRMNNAFRLGNG